VPILGLYEPFVKMRGLFEDKGQAVAQLVECDAVIRKVAGSIPDGINGISH